ncbi:MAG: aminotransferase class III-fold pyridoxal phosphate-dependent enzyme [candidate division Zixibacteria bacterium]|nr:aminotransferase class III-fold pyridoxal phosphate-dependent enzyme [candidate division Zixibacteria bacterium]
MKTDTKNEKRTLRLPKTTKIPLSLAMQEKAKRLIPGMTQLLSKRPDMFAPGVWPGYYSKAKGAEVWDLDGNKYIDMSISGIGANVLGYADPDVDAAVLKAIANGSSSSLNCPEEVELAELLCDIHPWAEMVRYSRAGGEATTIAIRIARTATGRDKVAFCGYHGWHDWYLSANLGTENALGEHLISGLEPNGVPKALAGTALPFRYNKIEKLKAIVAEHGNDLAAIIMEPVRNEPPDLGFMEGVRMLADKTGAVFIMDEISAGFRMNSGGAHLLMNVTPDMAVFSKAMGNGYPIAAIIGRASIMQAAQKTFISSTNWSERIGPTAALATIRKHQKVNAGEHLMTIGKAIQAGWTKAGQAHGITIDVGGIPPLSHFSFEGSLGLSIKALFVQKMLEREFLASTSFYSMYAHTEKHVKDYLVAVDEVLADIAELQKLGTIESSMIGGPATSGFKRLN